MDNEYNYNNDEEKREEPVKTDPPVQENKELSSDEQHTVENPIQGEGFQMYDSMGDDTQNSQTEDSQTYNSQNYNSQSYDSQTYNSPTYGAPTYEQPQGQPQGEPYRKKERKSRYIPVQNG